MEDQVTLKTSQLRNNCGESPAVGIPHPKWLGPRVSVPLAAPNFCQAHSKLQCKKPGLSTRE